MFINDVHKREEIRTIATQHLREYGVKYRPKKRQKNSSNNVNNKYGKKRFKVPLEKLDTQTVTLPDGRQLIVPKLVHELCSFILTKVGVEGVFRKEGSKSRQNEIKLSLDRGCLLGDDHHVIDVAVVLKSFLRELPEPLVPFSFHELFLRCSICKEKEQAILLACLLLPSEHLNVLSYLMQFFFEVARYHELNKMTINNISILLGPNIFPIDEKTTPKSQLLLTKICDITRIMIENSKQIGVIPDFIIDQIKTTYSSDDSHTDQQLNDKRKKKRRSGSLTRMFNGLKKMVSSKSDETPNANVTPDLLITPSISRTVKKRKADVNGLSIKKKKDILNKLPEGSLLSTPFTPQRTPICANPNPKRDKQESTSTKDRKMQWSMRSQSAKNLKDDDSSPSCSSNTRRNSIGTKTMLERRWSAVSQAANPFRRKKKSKKTDNNSDLTNSDVLEEDEATKKSATESDYIRLAKSEYEEIKSRVSVLEKRISMEFEKVDANNDNSLEKSMSVSNLDKIQDEYEKISRSESLSPTTDHLARRLSRELRIRRSSDHKMIRSPSARKIGSIRRRSRELQTKERQKLTRNQSWHFNDSVIIPRVSRYRKRASENFDAIITDENLLNINKRITRSSSIKNNAQNNWVSGENYFANSKVTPTFSCDLEINRGRPSLAQLRSQNAGMVLAKAKLFDNLKDNLLSTENNSSSCSKSNLINKPKTVKTDRISYKCKARSLKLEEKQVKTKQSMSPRRNLKDATRKKFLMGGNELFMNEKENVDGLTNNLTTKMRRSPRKLAEIEVESPKRTPKNMPQIKRTIGVKSPKRLCRTPQIYDRSTPLKVISTPGYKI